MTMSAKKMPLTALIEQRAFDTLLKSSGDWYWEQDECECFTLLVGDALQASGFDASALIGRSWDEKSSVSVPTLSSGDESKIAPEPHLTRQDFTASLVNRNGELRYVRASREPLFDEGGAFSGYLGVARDITDAVFGERLVNLEHAVTRRIGDAATFALAIEGAVQIICESEHWECGDYWSLDERAGVRRLLHSWCVDDPAVRRFQEQSRGMVLPAAQGNVGKVFASGRPFWNADMSSSTATPRARAEIAREAGLRALFIWPIAIGEKTLAAISFNTRKIREPNERFLQAFEVIGNQIGRFLELKYAKEVLLESEERFRSLTKLSSDAYWEQDEDYRFTTMSSIDSMQAPSRPSKLIGKRRWDQDYLNMTPRRWEEHIAMLDARKPFRDLELCWLDDNSESRWVNVSGEPVFDSEGRFKGYRGVGNEITVRKRSEERVQYMAHHDVLTGLPNRAMFGELLHTTVELAKRNGSKFAVMFIDLDRFKLINDTLGHEAGDDLLKETSIRLKQSVRASDIVARLGGDEFVVLAQAPSDPSQLEIVARRILTALGKPLSIRGQQCRITGSIGICVFPEGAQDEQKLMQNADAAMYRAKEAGKNNYQFYSSKTGDHSLGRLALETSLRHALSKGEFTLHYQARLDLETRHITALEALLRWQHPDLGMVAPGEFIPIAEESGLIVPIGKWVLETACRQSVAWQREGLPPVCMGVNLSLRQLTDDNFVEDLERMLLETGLRPELLELELKENMVMQDVERTGKVLTAINRLGVRLAIDDFGVGYSSLGTIKRFPIDTLKLDRSIIRNAVFDVEGNTMTQAIIAMAKTFSMTVVAEGVETQEQQSFMQEQACDEIQGFHFSKAIAGADFPEFFRRHIASSEENVDQGKPLRGD
jgi:diguanylate cyclase (GGDEF)-like protein/PAS domain S-box-containing protein